MNHLYEQSSTLHLCESAQIHPRNLDTYLVWTKCGIDVPANRSFKSEEVPNCVNCASVSEEQK